MSVSQLEYGNVGVVFLVYMYDATRYSLSQSSTYAIELTRGLVDISRKWTGFYSVQTDKLWVQMGDNQPSFLS